MKKRIKLKFESINDWKLSLNFRDESNNCELISNVKIVEAFENVETS